MGKGQLKSKIEEQQIIYQALKAGNDDTVRYKEFHNGEWGTDDENYTNRLRRITFCTAISRMKRQLLSSLGRN